MVISELDFSELIAKDQMSSEIVGGVYTSASAYTYAGDDEGAAQSISYAEGKTTSTYTNASVKDYGSVVDSYAQAKAYAKDGNRTSRSSHDSISFSIYR